MTTGGTGMKRGLRLLGGVAWLCLSAAGAARAESGPVDEVTVTGARSAQSSEAATKTDTPLIEAPQSISVIPAATVDLQGAQSLGEALRYSAGVNAEQYGGVDQRIDWFMIRGFPNSAPYIDGLNSNSRYTLMSPKVDPYGLERIEVLRGPSSVLYGQNIPGGLINAVSKRPQDAAGGEVALQTGSYGRLQGMLDLTGPLDSDLGLDYRLTAMGLDSGTQVDHVENRHSFVAPAFSWHDDKTRFTLLTHYEHQQDGFALQNLPAAGTLYPSPYGTVSTSLFTGEPDLNSATLSQWDVGYDFEHKFSPDWIVRQNLRFARIDVGLGYVSGYGQDSAQPQVMDRFSLEAHAHQQNFAMDTNVEGHLQTGPLQHTVLAGVDYSRSHDDWAEADGDAAPLDLTHPAYGGPIDLVLDYVTDDRLEQTGLYGQEQIRVGGLILTGSVREDWARTETYDVLGGDGLKQDDAALTGRGGIVYLFDDGLAPYFSYSTSFIPTIGTTYDGTPLRPTTARQWEGGVKYQPRGGTSFAMVSLYDLEEKNVTTADPDPDHPNQVVQTGAARVRGIEISGDADLGYGVTAGLAYSYMQSRITAANDGTEGNRLPDAPRHGASLWLDKAFTLDGGDRLTVGGGARYLGERYGDDANLLLLPSDTQYDAVLRYERDHWRFTLNARNVSDERVIATCDSTARCFYNERRSILATLGYRW